MSDKRVKRIAVNHIRQWLIGTAEGQDILHDILENDCLNCEVVRRIESRCLECGQGRVPILLVKNTNGRIPEVAVYADRNLVRIHVADMVYTETNKGYILAEEYLEQNLPSWCKELFYPSNRVEVLLLERVTAESLIKIQCETEWLKAAKEFVTSP